MSRNLYKTISLILIIIGLIACLQSTLVSSSNNIHILPGSEEKAVKFNIYGELKIGEEKTIIVKVYDKSYIHKKIINGEEKHFINFLVFHKNKTGWGESIKSLPNQTFQGPGGFVEKTDLPIIKAGDKWIGEIDVVITRNIKSMQVWKYKNSGEKYYGIDVQLPSFEHKFMKINARSDEGFYWDYYLYIPDNLFSQNLKYMLVEPNNTGTFSDDMKRHEQAAKKIAQRNRIAQKLGIPVLVPTFPRPKTIKGVSQKGWLYYTHSLDRQTLTIEKDIYKRLDKQLIAMIKHAQNLLKDKNINVKEKVFMFGFSASGTFVNRFAALHPNITKALATGGLNGLPILPIKMKKNKKLYYPVGIYDIKELTGKKFNYKAYKQIPQYIFMGDEDTNDTLPYPAPFNKQQKEIIKEIYNTRPVPIGAQDQKENAKIVVDRFFKAKEIYEKEDIQAQFVLYKGIGHKVTNYMIEDVVTFLKNNAGNQFNKISPHNSSF